MLTMDDNAQLIHTLLHQLSAVFARESDQILQEQLGLGMSQYKILQTLVENSAMQQRYIAVQLGQTEASISRQIGLLEQKGLIESMRNPINRREHITTLTTRGERITEAAEKVLTIHHSSSLTRLSKKEQLVLLDLLQKIAA
jgi:DNA-binding MarR family transcriptional regulator